MLTTIIFKGIPLPPKASSFEFLTINELVVLLDIFMSPRIAIITPCYNSMPYLQEMILSVLNQTYRNFVLILVDDRSEDSTKECIEKFSKLDNRVVVLYQVHGGVSQARNTGIDYVEHHGGFDYLYFLDSDELISNSILEIIKDSKAEALFFNEVLFTKKGNEKHNLIEKNLKLNQSQTLDLFMRIGQLESVFFLGT